MDDVLEQQREKVERQSETVVLPNGERVWLRIQGGSGRGYAGFCDQGDLSTFASGGVGISESVLGIRRRGGSGQAR